MCSLDTVGLVVLEIVVQPLQLQLGALVSEKEKFFRRLRGTVNVNFSLFVCLFGLFHFFIISYSPVGNSVTQARFGSTGLYRSL